MVKKKPAISDGPQTFDLYILAQKKGRLPDAPLNFSNQVKLSTTANRFDFFTLANLLAKYT